jgi:hypothetical protein
MRKYLYTAICGLVLLGSSIVAQKADSQGSVTPWNLNGTVIEACSCPMFCQCFFNTKPAEHTGHGAGHFCRFNNAFRVNKGKYGNVSLDGSKFWVAGDLGGDFSMGQMDWAVLHFDPSVKKEQRDGIAVVLAKLYPVTWNSFKVGDDYAMEWSYTKDRAVARLDGGRAAEVVLRRMPGNTDVPIVISNLKYWGAPRNEGFVLMPNDIEAYRLGDKAYESKGTNGFMITVDIASKDVKR